MASASQRSRFDTAIIVLLFPLILMYVVQLINVATDGAAKYYGIHPRDPGSLWFLVSSPFIHDSWIHLFNNTLCFVIFSFVCLMKGLGYYLRVSSFIVFVGGFFVWIFGAPGSVHIGASGWVFGLWSLLIASAWFERSITNIIVALSVIAFYGGLLYGVIPQQAHISFEAHLFGALSGIMAAALFSRRDYRGSEKTER